MRLNSFFKTTLSTILLVLSFSLLFACSGNNNKRTGVYSDLMDSRTVLSNSGVYLRVFDIDGNPLFNPGEQYSLRVTTEDNVREVVVATKTELKLRGSNLELRFDGKSEYPSDWQCGEAMSKYQPLSFTGCPNAGVIICSQVIPGTKEYKVSGELLRFKLRKGVHQVRETSGFEQNPDKDPILTEVFKSPAIDNEVQFTFNLRGEGNGNLIFDFADFGVVGAKYNQKRATNPDSEVADGNNNGTVDFADFGTIGANYNKGVGGIDIYRDDNNPPTTLYGRLTFDKKIKGDFYIDPKSGKSNSKGFKTFGFTVGGTGRYLKLVLVNNNSEAIGANYGVVDMQASGTIAWPMLGHDQNHSGFTQVIGPAANLLKWHYLATDNFSKSAIISIKNVIYIGNSSGELYSFNSKGTLNWKFSTKGPIYGAPAIDNDGYIYVGSTDKNVYCIKPDGTEAWHYTTGAGVISSPIIGPDGTVYIGSDDNKLYAFDKYNENYTGTPLWTFEANGTIVSSPALSYDGLIIFGTSKGTLYALDTKGKQQWVADVGVDTNTSPTLNSTGLVFIGSSDKKLLALDKSGKLQWDYQAPDFIAGIAVDPSGNVYFGAGSTLYVFKPDGSSMWNFKTDGNISGAPAIDSKGVVYVSTMNKKLYAINPDSTNKWEFWADNNILTSPALGPDGTIYIGDANKKLYAINDNVIYPPEDVEASKGTDKNKIKLKWKKPAKGKVPAKFNIKRKKAGGELKLVKSVAGDVYEWEDIFDEYDDSIYYYGVTSVDEEDNESDLSNIAEGWLEKEAVTDKRGDWWTVNGNAYNNRQSKNLDKFEISDKPKKVSTVFKDAHPDDKIISGGVYNSGGVGYFGTEKGYVYAYDYANDKEVFYKDPLPQDEDKYKQPLNGPFTVLPNGHVFGGSINYDPEHKDYNQVFIINESGGPLSIFSPGGPVEGGAYPTLNGDVYWGCMTDYPDGGFIFRYNENEKRLYPYPTNSGLVSSPTLVPGTDPNTGRLIFVGYTSNKHNDNLWEVDLSNGNILKHDGSKYFPDIEGGFGDSLLSSGDGSGEALLYGNSEDGHLYGFDWPYTNTITPEDKTPITTYGAPLAMTQDSNLIVFDGPTNSLYGYDKNLKKANGGKPITQLGVGQEHKNIFVDRSKNRILEWFKDQNKNQTVIKVFIFDKDFATIQEQGEIRIDGDALVMPNPIGYLTVLKSDGEFFAY